MLRRLICVTALVSFSLVNLANAQNESPLLYFFTNPNCAPCLQVKREVELLASKNYPVKTVILNSNPELAQQFNVRETPTTILVSDGKIVGRHAGPIDALSIVGWFDAARTAKAQNRSPNSPAPTRRRSNQQAPAVVQGRMERSSQQPIVKMLHNTAIPKTMHKGTRTPNNAREYQAMRSTVRIRVEDQEGISFATGTVIHSQNGENLVITCGHVFRDTGGQGIEISGDVGFESNEIETYPARLIGFDAGARDIGLVVVKTGFDIEPVALAPFGFPVQTNDPVFSLGCDHGEDATIRHTRIKRQAMYGLRGFAGQAKKYDIFGRPVDGRSGGGLFTAGGQLVGVCNAAALQVDEGVYTSLDNIYWQLDQVGLVHLFTPEKNQAIVDRIASRETPQEPALGGLADNRSRIGDVRLNPVVNDRMAELPRPQRQFPRQNLADEQLLVVIQTGRGEAKETMVIKEPSSQLLEHIRDDYQKSMGNTPLNVVSRDMPVVPRPERQTEMYRAQSFR